MSMFLRPVSDQILVELEEAPEATPGGIHLPKSAAAEQQEARRGTVFAVGPGPRFSDGRRYPPDVSEGDVVWVRPYSGTILKVLEREFRVVSEGDLLAAERSSD